MNRIISLYIALVLCCSAGLCAFADDPGSALDDKPSVDTAAQSNVQVPALPADNAADTHTSYLYDLKKLIEKSRANIKEVNEKIKEQAVLKRNQKREERSREYYEKGVELTKEGRLDEARDYFEKAIRITEHPEMAGYIKESQRRLRKQEKALEALEAQHHKQIKLDESARKEDVEEAYKEAVELYKQKKFHPAKDAFEHVDEIAPDYRATNSYLKIIDQDIISSDAAAAKQQAIEIGRQQKEAEAARAKEKAMWLAQIEEKEKQRKEAIDKQAAEVYDEAVVLFKKKKYAQAKKKFQEVSWVIPDYKATMKYLARIDRDAQIEQKRIADEQQKALQEQRWEEEVQRHKQEAQKARESAVKHHRRLEDLQEEAQFLYKAAVKLYEGKFMDEALDKFNDIENTCPDYKSTRSYIARIKQWQIDHHEKLSSVQKPPEQETGEGGSSGLGRTVNTAFAQAVVPGSSPGPAPGEASKMQLSAIDQEKQVEDISELAQKSAQLYSQITDIADDRQTIETKRKMAGVEEILNNLKNEKERILRQIHEEQSRRQQEEENIRIEEHRAQIAQVYREAKVYYSAHDYVDAKIKFMAVESAAPGYKGTRGYLASIENYQQHIGIAQIKNYHKNEEGQLREVESKENAEKLRREQAEREERRQLELKQKAQLQTLAQQASAINDDILRLSKQQDYDGMKAKFVQLENVIGALRALKDEMGQRKISHGRDKKMDREYRSLHQQNSRDENWREYQAPWLEKPSQTEQYKRRELKKEQDELYDEAVGLYDQNKYIQAKVLFDELADQQDRRAMSWLKRLDRVMGRGQLKTQALQARERSSFIDEQIKAQRQLALIQERDRLRQKKLTEDLERQKRTYEDNRLLELRKEEALKAQEHEREVQEARLKVKEKADQQDQEKYRFHKIKIIAALPPAQKNPAFAPKPQVKISPSTLEIREELREKARYDSLKKTAGETRKEKENYDSLNKMKLYYDRKFKKEQEEQARQARISAAAQDRERKLQERLAEKEHKRELDIQLEKNRLELMRERNLEREEKIRQDEILRQENQRRRELEIEERRRQAQIETQRESVRKQLEDGVEAMYQEALSLYKQGDFTQAAEKFKDIQDVLPGYKRSGQYLDESRLKSMTAFQSSEKSYPEESTSSPATASPTMSRQDDVSKALDLFDPNVK